VLAWLWRRGEAEGLREVGEIRGLRVIYMSPPTYILKNSRYF